MARACFLLASACLAGLTSARLDAQSSVTITGLLIDAQSGEPVAAASVVLAGTAVSGITADDGRFRLSRVAPGRYLLRVAHVGYGTLEDSLVVEGQGPVELVVRVSPRAIVLEPVEAAAARPDRRRRSPTHLITREEIEAVLETAPNVADVVRAYIPGASVRVLPGGYLCLELRAAHGSRTGGCNFPLVLIDDVPVNAPWIALRDLPPEDVEQIEFVPASQATARFGPRSQYGALVIRTVRAAVRARPVAEHPVPAPRYVAYPWARERTAYPWARVLAGAAVGGAAGAVGGLALLGCLDGRGSSLTACLRDRPVGQSLAALTLPLLGAATSAHFLGRTRVSASRPPHVLLAVALPLGLGYAMYRQGAEYGLSGSRQVGTALMAAGTPAAAALADHLFRRPRAGPAH